MGAYGCSIEFRGNQRARDPADASQEKR